MLDQTAPLLAERGFAVSTREIAAQLGVTQALIYKHFASKEDLIESVIARTFARRPSGPSVLADTSRPLAERLVAFYSRGNDRDQGARIKLFVRAALEGWPLPVRRGTALTREVFEPVIRALRAEAHLPDLEVLPMTRGERELAMMLHGSIVFLGIRKHIYRMPMPDDRDVVVALYVAIFLGGAREALRRIHAGEMGAGLEVRQLMARLRHPDKKSGGT